MNYARNYLQISRFLKYYGFSCLALSMCQVQFVSILTIQESYHPNGLSGGGINPFRSTACIWWPTRCATKTPSGSDEKSPLESNPLWKFVADYALIIPIWPDVRIISCCTVPHRLHVSAFPVSFFIFCHYRRTSWACDLHLLTLSEK